MGEQYTLSAAILVAALLGAPLASYGKPGGASAEGAGIATNSGGPVKTDGRTVPGDQTPPVAAESLKPRIDDISALLPLLSGSDERKQFVVELEALLKEGKFDSAKRQIKTAIDIGALAIILADHIHDQLIFQGPQAQERPGVDQPASQLPLPTSTRDESAALAGCGAVAEASSTNLSELQQALERERARGDAVKTELTAALEEAHARQVRQDNEAMSSAAKIAELQNILEAHNAHDSAAQQAFASTEERLRNLQASHDQSETQAAFKLAEFQEIVGQEREKAQNRELVVRAELREAQSLYQELKASTASTIRELERTVERQKEEAAQRDEKLRDLQVRLKTSVTSPNTSHRVEIARPDQVVGDIGARSFLMALGHSAWSIGAAPLSLDVGATPLNVPSAPMPETPIRSDAIPMAQGKQLGDVSPTTGATVETGVLPRSDDAESNVVGATSALLPPVTVATADDDLMERAETLFRRGDVIGARLLLERIVKSGNSRAAFLLAETFDPYVLSKVGVRGIPSDAEQARRLYAKALLLGNKLAVDRIEALK